MNHAMMLANIPAKKKLSYFINEQEFSAKQNPRDPEIKFVLGMAYFLNDQLKDATLAIEEGLKLQQYSLIGLAYHGMILVQLGELIEAKADLAFVLEKSGCDLREDLDPLLISMVEAHLGIIESSMQDNRDEALKYFNQSLEHDKKNVIALFYLGSLYDGLFDYGRALECYEACASCHSSNFPLYLQVRSKAADNAALIYFDQNDFENEKKWVAYASSLTYGSNAFIAWLKWGYFCIRTRDINGANSALDSALLTLEEQSESDGNFKTISLSEEIDENSEIDLDSLQVEKNRSVIKALLTYLTDISLGIDISRIELPFCLSVRQKYETKLALLEIGLTRKNSDEKLLQLRANLVKRIIARHLDTADQMQYTEQLDKSELQLQQALAKAKKYSLVDLASEIEAKLIFTKARLCEKEGIGFPEVMAILASARQVCPKESELLNVINRFEIDMLLVAAELNISQGKYDDAIEVLVPRRSLMELSKELEDVYHNAIMLKSKELVSKKIVASNTLNAVGMFSSHGTAISQAIDKKPQSGSSKSFSPAIENV